MHFGKLPMQCNAFHAALIAIAAENKASLRGLRCIVCREVVTNAAENGIAK